MSKLFITQAAAVLALVALAGCAAPAKEHVVTKTQYIVLAPNAINTRATAIPDAVLTGCDEKSFNARSCFSSRTLTADRAYTALRMCNDDKAEIRKTLINLRAKADKGEQP